MIKNTPLNGTIFDIQGFSVHDGPGCRTLIFLKGCTLNCKWCSNPEGRNPDPVIMYNHSKCVHDNICIKSCPKNAISTDNNLLKIDRKKCESCNNIKTCVSECPTGALKIAGYRISVDDLFKKLQRDRDYWGKEGGITLTGGEPLFQANFAKKILKLCYESYIHTAIETCGNVPWTAYEKTIPYLEWIFYDIKHINNKKHIEGTGTSNHLILTNAQKLALNFKERLIFRTTIIPGYNDSKEDITELALFLSKLPRQKKEINILSLHHLGREKYRMLGYPYFSNNLEIPKETKMEEIKNIFNNYKIECYINSNTPF
jgi:pyruvate formate lyase activating enzyme